MNVFCASGNIGRDCEVRVTANGKSIASFPLAVKSGYGEHESTLWVKCLMFGKRAESKLPEYLTKGAKVSVTGELKLDEWTAQDGTKRTTLEMRVNDIDLGGKAESRPAPSQPAEQPAPDNSGFDTDIPF